MKNKILDYVGKKINYIVKIYENILKYTTTNERYNKIIK